MKVLPTLLFAAVIATQSLAQITIDANDMPAEGNVYRVLNADTAGMQVPATGANMSWDYSALVELNERNDTFVNVTATPTAYQLFFNNGVLYPEYKATFALEVEPIFIDNQISIEDQYSFFKNDPANYKLVGIGARINGVPSSVKYDSIDYIYRFPMNYNQQDSCVSVFFHSVPNTGTFGQYQQRINHVDGWGSITTPYGTFNDVLRVRSELHVTDTIYIDNPGFGFSIPRPTSVEYKWLTKDKGIPVMQINSSILVGNEVVTRAMWMDSVPADTSGPSGIFNQPVTQNDFLLYPNPSHHQVSVTFGGNASQERQIKVTDVNGQTVYQSTVTAVQAKVSIPTENWAPGMYLVQVEAGDAIQVKLLAVQR